MNNAQYLIDNIKKQIPIEILNMAFMNKPSINGFPVSLDNKIRQDIIINYVNRDTNMIAGEQALISLQNIPIEDVGAGLLVKVGLTPTAGRIITSVLSISYGMITQHVGGPGIASAVTPALATSDARVEIVGENIIYIEGWLAVQLTALRVVLTDDPDYANLSPRALPPLSELTTLACKAYIYNKLTIQLGSGQIVSGVDYGRIKEIVDSYSEAYEEYHRQLSEEWGKIRFMADRIAVNRFTRMLVPRL